MFKIEIFTRESYCLLLIGHIFQMAVVQTLYSYFLIIAPQSANHRLVFTVTKGEPILVMAPI